MRKLFALVLVLFLWMPFAAPASADVAGLTPCGKRYDATSESPV